MISIWKQECYTNDMLYPNKFYELDFRHVQYSISARPPR